ncbi:Hypothetical predicted protein [Podarcis lilfordi]|uniref:Uncharacterized protein n=1 Tax=Podarcis lilfordi TaxID=74358 RepID=A0AA35LEF9_9SAUR|nr:Hypothetical predicted protein [Podarcis lilfordi]
MIIHRHQVRAAFLGCGGCIEEEALLQGIYTPLASAEQTLGGICISKTCQTSLTGKRFTGVCMLHGKGNLFSLSRSLSLPSLPPSPPFRNLKDNNLSSLSHCP